MLTYLLMFKMSVTDKPLPYRVCVCHKQSQSVTDSVSVKNSMCLSQTIWVCQRQSVSVINSLCLEEIICVCHRQCVPVTDSLYLSKTVVVCHKRSLSCQRKYVSVTDSICLSQTFCVVPRSCFFTDSLCLSQTGCVCHRQFWFCARKFLYARLCLYQTIFLIILDLIFTKSALWAELV